MIESFSRLSLTFAHLVSQHRLGLEAASLRQQLVVLKRKQPRPRLRSFDRLFCVALQHGWGGWADALIIVKADAVVSWHRVGFRLLWRLRSQRLGQPKISEEIRMLIRRMKTNNPSWGAPRIHAELQSLGFDVSLANGSHSIDTV